MDWENVVPVIVTVFGSLAAAYFGSWSGARAALTRFKQERAFDTRLRWYEDVARTLADFKLSIEVARTFEEDPREPVDAKLREWGKTQAKYMELVRVEGVSLLYAPPDVGRALLELRERCDEIADESNGWDPPELHRHMDALNNLIERIDSAMLLHARTVRRELNFEPLATALGR
jgi:hypothetical protein